MEEEISYRVEITPEAEIFFEELLKYLYKTHSENSAKKKLSEIIELAFSLTQNLHQGSQEESLLYLGKDHQYLVYFVTKRKTVKIIYFVNEVNKTVYITDFFRTLMLPDKIKKRNLDNLH